MDVDMPADLPVPLAPDDEETWLYVMRKVLPDLRSERPMAEHPDDSVARAPVSFPLELRVLPAADCTSAHLRKVLQKRLEHRSALQDMHHVAQERLFNRHEVHTLSRLRAQEDSLREPCDGDEDEFRLMARKLRTIHAQAVYFQVGERVRLLQDQEARLKRAREVLGYLENSQS